MNGFSDLFTGLRFPVRNGYVYIRTGGGYDPRLRGAGVVPESAALLHTAVVAGIAFEVRFEATNQPISAAP